MENARPRRVYVPVIGPRLKPVLFFVLILFTLLATNAVYLGGVTFAEWRTGQTYQDYFYQYMFLGHLTLGLLLVVPFLFFGAVHLKRAWKRPNRRAVKAGVALFSCALLLLLSGLGLVRFDFFEIRDPAIRNAGYWLHVITPLVCAWLFLLHRLAGRNIRWKTGLAIGTLAAASAAAMVVFQAQDPRQWNVTGPSSGVHYFFPSLARTATGNFIPARVLMMDSYCEECHKGIHKQWAHSAHRFSSFNNPAYLFSVRNTRKVTFERDGNVQASRFCAGCHDPVPFFSGAFDNPKFDDVNDRTAHAGVTCTVCHAITHINSPKGNSDYTIDEPIHYPFAFSKNPFLHWVNKQLIKAKPAFHKKTFLKPLHKDADFCGTCHKVHLPKELNDYKWLRGQDHFDAYLLSGVSGHGVSSFYYPPKAQTNCNGCHMPLLASNDFAAKRYQPGGPLSVHDHMFPSANTAIPHLLGMPAWVNEKHRRFLDGVMKVDIFALRDGGTIDGPLEAPLRPQVPTLEPGHDYLVEVVVRTMKMGHTFTQGTADSNEIWLELTARAGDRIIGHSGGTRESDGMVDPWAHYINAYVLDRKGNRIDRRNPEDIFVPLYNHQIPPGAADVIHYHLHLPADVAGPVTVDAALHYRKFDTTYMRLFQGKKFVKNDLPVTDLAVDRVEFPVAGRAGAVANEEPKGRPLWQRWNDYGIGLLRKPRKSQLRQAEEAFTQVEALGRGDGALNLARVYVAEGQLDEAALALRRAGTGENPAYPWTIAWFSALVDKQNGYLDQAITELDNVVDTRFTEARKRGFDFSEDYRALNELGETLFERARQQRGESRKPVRDKLLQAAVARFQAVLRIDPENVTAHYDLAQIYQTLGDTAQALAQRQLHARYKADDNAMDYAVAEHRLTHPAADHAAEPVVIYDLERGTAGALAAERPPAKTVATVQAAAPKSHE